jgi:glycosyltransferase involved in cell wall biosynthesis
LAIITVTDDIKTMYVEAGVPEEKIFVASSAVNLEAFVGLPDKDSLRRSLDLPLDRFIATYSGHLYPGRGIEDILQCASTLKDVQFLFIGGWDEDVAKRRSETQHLSNSLIKGFVPNLRVAEYLAASDVLLMPHSKKCKIAAWMSPLKLFEYMASHRPIIASHLPALLKYLQNGRNARLVPPDSPVELTEAIAWVCDNRDQASRLARTAFEDVQSCTWENRAKAILNRFVPDWSSSS